MINMIAGVYGLPVKQPDGKTRVVGMGPESGPFAVDPAREAELVSKGIARYVEQPKEEPKQDFVEQPKELDEEDIGPIGMDEMPPEDMADELPDGVIGIPEYSVDMKAAELREIGAMCGLTFPANMKKADMVAALDAHIEANMVDDEDAPVFDAAEAVQ